MRDAYNNWLAQNNFHSDPSQHALIELMASYIKRIDESKLSQLFRSRENSKKGIYIWGNVGRGKSALATLLFQSIASPKKSKKHFHEFMLNVHKTLDGYRQDNTKEDYIKKFAKTLSKKYKALILDELQVNNIVDAMIVGRLFEAMMDNGCYIFFTSNRKPDDLFKDGLQRDRFLPFIALVKARLDIYHLEHESDYRLGKTTSIDDSYLWPYNAHTISVFHKILEHAGVNNFAKQHVKIDNNRAIEVQKASNSIALFHFDELCGIPMGASDYLALCKAFSMIAIENIPLFNQDMHNEALRFITLIDCMYESKTQMLFLAQCNVEDLYKKGKNSFEFDRTISRITEMQSVEYRSNARSRVS